MLIKTRDGKFLCLGTSGTIIHLTSTYGCTKSLESLTSVKHQFTFISDDYIDQYRDEFFSTKDQMNKFVRFLEQLNITEFLQVNNTDTRNIRLLFSIDEYCSFRYDQCFSITKYQMVLSHSTIE